MNRTTAKSPLSRLHQWLLAWLFILYFLLGMVFLVERWAKTQVDEWQGYIAAYLSQQSGLQWSLQGLSLDYHRLNPVVSIEQLRAGLLSHNQSEESIPVVAVQAGEVYIDLARSLLHRQLIVHGVQAQRVDVVLERQGQGWGLAGVSHSSAGSTQYDVLTQLHTLSYFNVARFQLAQLIKDNGALQLNSPAELGVRYARDGQLRQFELSGKSEKEGEHSILQVVVKGDLKPGGYELQAYGASRENRLGQWVNDFFAASDLLDFDVEFVASQNRGGRLKGALIVNSASISLSDTAQDTPTTLAVSDAEAQFGQYPQGRWLIDWPTFTIEQGTQYFDFAAGQLVYTQDGNVLQLAMPEVNLGLLTQTFTESRLWASVLGDKIHALIEQLDLGGFVDSVKLTVPLSNPKGFEFAASMRDASIGSFRGAPAGSGINGELWLGAQSGRVELFGNSVTALGFPGIYSSPLKVGGLRGNVGWELADYRVNVVAPALGFSHIVDEGVEDGDYAASLALNIGVRPAGENEAATMALSISASNADVASMLPLVPEVAPASLVEWLTNSNASGRVSTGSFIYNGSLRPGESQRRSVALLINLEDAGLRYLPGWPAVSDATAQLAVHDQHVTASVQTARVQAMDIAHAQLKIGPTTGALQLDIAAGFSGDAANIVQLLQKAPLGQSINDLFMPWSGAGLLNNGSFSLSMPLQGATSENIDLTASADVHDAQFFLSDLDLDFKNISGHLGYSSSTSVVSRNLTADLWGEEIAIDFAVDESRSGATSFLASGQVDVDRLRIWLDQPLLHFANGKTLMEVAFLAAPSETTITATSRLSGVTIDLPAPFNKKANEELALQFSWEMSGDEQPMRLQLGNQALMHARFEQGKMLGAHIALGDKAITFASDNRGHDQNNVEQGLLRLDGQFSHLETKLWFPVIEQYVELLENTSSINDVDKALPLTGTLLLDTVTAFDVPLAKTQVDFRETASRWDIDISNADVAGRVSMPSSLPVPRDRQSEDNLPMLPVQMSSEERIHVDLDYLRLPQSLLEQDDTNDPALLPADLPAMDIAIESLSLGGRPLGRWSFLLTASDKTALVHRIDGQMQKLTLSSEPDDGLLWAVNDDGDTISSANLVLASDDFESFLKSLVNGGGQLPMQSKKLDATVSLDWEGYPQDIAFESVSGTIDFSFEEGRFYEAPEGATGIMKLLGLINFDTLIRRVQLDFADVYKEGLSFDEIYGSVHLSDQLVSFYEPPVYFKGPSSEFKLTGEIDLGKNIIDASLIATLPVANNLPWVGAVAGGLPGAAGAYVFTKMFGSQLRKLSSASYVISGSLNDPSVEFERLFENKNRRTINEGVDEVPQSLPEQEPDSTN